MTAAAWVALCVAVIAGPGPVNGRAESAPAAQGLRKTQAPVDLVWLAGPPSHTAPTQAAPPNTAKLRGRGVKLWKQRCASCHGTWGDGKGQAAIGLDFPVPDFTKGVFKLRSTPSGTLPRPEDLFATVSRGMHGTRMFPWVTLPEADRWALVYRVMSFSPRFAQEEPGKSFVVPAPPPETPALVAQGRALYERHRCGVCHGAQGAADGPATRLYKEPAGVRPVKIRDFTRGQFLRGSSPEDIFLTLKTGLDGTPMGAYDALAAQELWALSAYVRDLVQRRRLPDAPAAE